MSVFHASVTEALCWRCLIFDLTTHASAVSKSTYTQRIEIKVSLMHRGLAKQKCL